MIIIDPTIDKTFYQSVRGLLGGVDEDTLPNEDISDATILNVAELQVLDLVPDFASLSDTDKEKVRLATIYVIASLLCPSMPSRVEVEVKTIDVTWKKRPVDYAELETSLLAKASNLLERIIGSDSGVKVFAIAPSKRAVKACEEN